MARTGAFVAALLTCVALEAPDRAAWGNDSDPPFDKKPKDKDKDKDKDKFKEKTKGHGKDIATKVKATRFEQVRQVTWKKEGKHVTFLPAQIGRLRSERDLETGQIIGVLDTELTGRATGLPPGRYNLFLLKEGGGWTVYAETGGQVVAQAKEVKVFKEKKGKGRGRPERPRFVEDGWYWEECYEVVYQEATSVEIVEYYYTVSIYW